MMRAKKRASLSLTEEVIVTSIIAMVFLGLAVFFVRQSFSSTEKKFSERVEVRLKEEIINKLKESEERLTIEGYEFSVKKGDKKDIYFGIKNNLKKEYTFSILGKGNISPEGAWDKADSAISCYSAYNKGAFLNKTPVSFKAMKERKIDAGETVILEMIVEVSSVAAPTTYTCAIIIDNPSQQGKEYARKDFLITVERR